MAKMVTAVTAAMLLIAVFSVIGLGVYGIPVAAIVGLLGFHVFARWYHRRYYDTHTRR